MTKSIIRCRGNIEQSKYFIEGVINVFMLWGIQGKKISSSSKWLWKYCIILFSINLGDSPIFIRDFNSIRIFPLTNLFLTNITQWCFLLASTRPKPTDSEIVRWVWKTRIWWRLRVIYAKTWFNSCLFS